MSPASSRPAGPPDQVLEAPAKVNLFLEVLGRRDDGYHEIETVMQSVDLSDRLEFWTRPAGEHSLSVSGRLCPADGSNLVLRAAGLLAAAGGARSGAHIHLDKRIPVGGGMGGGSSDAAAALRGLDRLWGLGSRPEDLGALGARLGSDVNFFLYGGLAVCRGRGERVEPLKAYYPLRYRLRVPQLQVATRDIYARLGMRLTTPRRGCTTILEALGRGDWVGVGRELYNALEAPAFQAYPELAAAKRELAGPGVLGTLLCGSGSVVFAMTPPESGTDQPADSGEGAGTWETLACRSTPGWG
jgi:4-diphosphocytidyl-2-C-methyl-D-erythritol kinase